MVTAGCELELPPIAFTVRQRDVLEGMSDIELALQPSEIAERGRKRR